MSKGERAAVVVGLGNLGASMAARLLDVGWDLQVADRDPRRVDQIAALGAARDLDIPAAKVICLVTPDEVAVAELLDSGALEGLTRDHVVLLHSTVLPERARALADRIAPSGAAFVEAPVSGGSDRAKSGDLTIFVGGDARSIDAAGAVLHDLGSQIFVMGEVGAASATKLANQLVLFAATAGLHEALRLTESFEVEDAAVLEALASGLGDSWAGRHWGFFDQLAADYEAAGVAPEVRPWAKDLREMVEAAEAAGTPSRVASVLAEVVPEFIETHARSARSREEQR
jgi:3-hydroxyisobutyrate dehydrogenase-like beta-hydroxyacid dehydrogenase